MRTIILLAVIPLLLFSCNKPRDGQTKAEGQVVDQHTNAAVADATVNLMQRKINSVNASYSLVESWQADAEGRFSVHFEGNDSYDYILMASTPLGHYTSWQNAPSVTSGGKNKDVKVPAQAPAWVRVHLVDEEPKQPAWIYMNGITNPGEQFYIHGDTIMVRTVSGGVNTRAYFRITTQGNPEVSFFKNIFAPSLDTVTLLINY